MRKTSVYLTAEEAEQLRRIAASERRPQAELIREGVRRVIAEAGGEHREFRSLGKGHGGGAPYGSWDSDELYHKELGER